jgi:hypothetical protein
MQHTGIEEVEGDAFAEIPTMVLFEQTHFLY